MRGVTCASGVDLLMDHLEGVLTPDVSADLEGHVSACPRCAAFVASYRDTPRILRQATAVAIPPDLEASLFAFLRARRV